MVVQTLEEKLKTAFKGKPYRFSHLGPESSVGTRSVYFTCPACGPCSFLLVNPEQVLSEVDNALSLHGKTHDSC